MMCCGSVWYSVLFLLQTRYATGSLSWPEGEYTLLKPKTGCPTGWEDNGFLFQDTVDASPSNNRSDTLHIDGHVAPNYVVRSFCIKTTYNGGPDWSEGKYCIYKRSYSWLSGMRPGWIQMYDEENNNKDATKFTYGLVTLPSQWISDYYYVKLNFYCKTKGNKKTPIELPITKPFYLLPYGSSECQQVKWMVATTEWIKYHTRDYQGHHKYGRTVPHYELGSSGNKGIKMYYCYYRSCNYSLTERTGIFQSPGFPRKYPDGQLCLWRITVPANHTIRVHFTNFSLYGNDTKDTLKYSKKTKGSFRLHYTLQGDVVPFTVTANTDLEFAFRSDEAGSSHGFRAEYSIFLTRESTSTKGTTKTTMARPRSTPDIATKTTSIPTSTPTKATTTTVMPACTPTIATTTASMPVCRPTMTITTTITFTCRPTLATITATISTTRKPTKVTTTPLPEKKTSPTTNITRITQDKPTLRTTPDYQTSRYADTFKGSRGIGQDANSMIVVIVIAVVCFLISVVLLIVMVCRYRVRETEHTARNLKREAILLKQPTHATTNNTTVDTNNGTQMFKPMTRDIPEYEDVDYEKLNKATLNMKTGSSKSKSFRSIDANPVYHVLEGPDPISAPPEERTYDDVEEEEKCTPNPLYKANPQNIYPKNSKCKEFESSHKDNADTVYHVLEGPDPNIGPPEDQTYDDVDEEDKCTFNPLYESSPQNINPIILNGKESQANDENDADPVYYVLERQDSISGPAEDQNYEDVDV